MSAKKTYGEILSFVRGKLDLQEESFITPMELLGYAGEAIKVCESEVQKLGIDDDYFAATMPLRINQNAPELKVPSRVFANKIKRLVYQNGSVIYEINRLRTKARYLVGATLNEYDTQLGFSYMIKNNDARVGSKFVFFPPPKEDTVVVAKANCDMTLGSNVVILPDISGLKIGYFAENENIPNGTRIVSIDAINSTVTLTNECLLTDNDQSIEFVSPLVTMEFIRSAIEPTTTESVIDFPEFWPFIAQYMIVECLKKELGNPRLAEEKIKLDDLKALVHSTLSDMVPDEDTTLEKDTSFYDDSGAYGGEIY